MHAPLHSSSSLLHLPSPGLAMEHHGSTLLAFLLLALAQLAHADTRSFQFIVQTTKVTRLCNTHDAITVNGQFPGPTLEVFNGDTVAVRVLNRSPYNVTIHWHGIRQRRTGWADGPEYVTQCPIRPGRGYVYRFRVEKQEGTLWWHAHTSWLRATVYGALVIRPAALAAYPFPAPSRDTTVLLGEWWDGNPMDVAREAARTGAAPNVSDAYTINGQPGDLYKCSAQETVVIPVDSGEMNLLRVINAALNQELSFAVANHKLTVVGADASYTKPFTTGLLVLGPGMTADVLLSADQPPSRYYAAAAAYVTARDAPFDNTTATAILEYRSAPCPGGRPIPVPVPVPAPNDTAFAAGLRSLRSVFLAPEIDEDLFFTVGLGIADCPSGTDCRGPVNGTRFTASMNNVSFVLPSRVSILQAHHLGVPGVFTADFSPSPPVTFDYTGNVSRSAWQPERATRAYPLKFGSRVRVVLQGTSFVTAESHPVHLHGYDFYTLAEGLGNFNPETHEGRFNLVDPPLRNTVMVPANGWAVIRFVADNPGVWVMHCHLDVHINWGLAMVFVVENGGGDLEALEPPPSDLPEC